MGKTSVPLLRDNPENDYPSFPLAPPLFALQSFQSPNISILFIVNDSSSFKPNLDQFFFDYMNFSYSVTSHDANGSYNYTSYDAIVISDSIPDSSSVASLVNATIPILSMEVFTFDLFGFGNTTDGNAPSTTFTNVINYFNNTHYITSSLNVSYNSDGEPYTIYDKIDSRGILAISDYTLVTIPSESQIDEIARPTEPSKKRHRAILALDKGKNDWNLKPAPERRAFWGAVNGTNLNQNGKDLWNKTLQWILYDDYTGNASLTVKVEDSNNQNIPNAEVTLNSSSEIINQFTNSSGFTTFHNISWGLYSISARYYNGTHNLTETLSDVKIAPSRTYYRMADFMFTVQLQIFLDHDPPFFYNIDFDKSLSKGTFFIDVIDESQITLVNLSLTAINLTDQTTVINNSFTMVNQSPVLVSELITYYNDTALDSLSSDTNISIQYYILAKDNAGNENKTKTMTLLLSDPDPPIIHEYNVTDYGDGTLEFYANITDISGVHDPVILHINGTPAYMHLNGSGFWTYRKQSFYGNLLNYTIYSVNDTVGNENGSKIPSFPMDISYITISDSTPPQINWVTPYITHDKGFIEWNVIISETTIFQSGLDFNSVNITISVNNEPNNTQSMYDLGADYFYYFDTFKFNDIVKFWINASDLVENFRIEYGILEINDTASPEVTFNAIEFRNGTVEFIASVIDWPSNITTVFAHENSTGTWLQYDLNQINVNLYIGKFSDFTYINRDLFYYVEAIDDVGNNNTVTQFKYLSLTDIVPPDINFVVENSPVIDGQITIRSLAIDSWGSSQYVTNPFYVNITQNDITTTYQMEQEVIYYVSTHSFKFSDQITIAIWTYDDAGNQGVISKSITIDDLAPPKIKNFGTISFQNGTVLVWAEVVEGENGSGLADDNSSVTIDLIHEAYINATMKWNGSGNFYTFSISGFVPGEAFTYQVKAIDKNKNVNLTEWRPVSIFDLTPPVYSAFDYSEELINHSAVELHFWAEVVDPFGTIAGVNFMMDYFDGYQWFNLTDQMNYNGSYYVYSLQLICNISFSYHLEIYDEALNVNETFVVSHKTLNFQPTTALGYGVEFNILELNPGEVRYWIQVKDTFEEHTFKDHYVTLSVKDETLGIQILTEKLMRYNGTHYIYNLSIVYLHSFTYVMQIIDDGVIEGYYEPQICSNSSQMLDYWKPIIFSSGIDQVNETTIIVWANISDWGSGVTEVLLNYEFIPLGGNGGTGSQINVIPMNFNDSLYIRELAFTETGTLRWFIEAYDSRGSSMSPEQKDPILAGLEQPGFFGLTLFQIILIVLGTALVIIAFIFGNITVQRKKSIKYQKTKDIQDKLSFVSNVFTILVSTEVGVPIYTVTNVLYQKDESLNDTLSGLSVGIDSFLQSFQSDFMHQVQEQSVEYSTETGRDEYIRMSVIEQHQMQILIAASNTYRIFVFLREKPSKFAKDAFYNAIKELEENVFIPNLGIVDEALYGPQTEAILRKHFPITLLMPFVIDTSKLKKFDEKLKRGLDLMPISRKGINSLKRLVITQTLSKMEAKNPQAEINLFDESMRKGLLKDARKLLFDDAKNIMTKLIKIPPEQIYEALWIGSSPDVEIIVPYEEFSRIS